MSKFIKKKVLTFFKNKKSNFNTFEKIFLIELTLKKILNYKIFRFYKSFSLITYFSMFLQNQFVKFK